MFDSQNSNDEDSNFWISYADLMAGLLFVFILLIGAIVSKSSILKSDLHKKEEKLEKISQSLKSKEVNLNNLSKNLTKSNSVIKHKDKTIKEKDRAIEQSMEVIRSKDEIIAKNERMLKLKIDEISKLNKMLLVSNTREAKLSDKIIIAQDLIKVKDKKLKKSTKKLSDYQGKVLVLSNELSANNKSAKIKDEKLLALLNAMDEKETKYDEIVAKLQSQKAKIKSLTGIKIKVVSALKLALGDKIDIDKKTGSLRLASNILFSVGKANLKPRAKVELKKAFVNYIGTLIKSKDIKPHLDKIIIEGHTDSDGSYIANLSLSQKRALAVMRYLLTLDFTKRYNIRPLMTASGRAYLDPIMKNGKEDKEASRRIEIKFRLKNEDAMNEIEKVLDAK